MRAFLPLLKPQKRRARKPHSTVQVRWPLFERTEFKDWKRARGSGGRPWTGGGELLHDVGPNVFFFSLTFGLESEGSDCFAGAWGLDQLYRGTVRPNSEGDCGREH